jgi:5'(3')-deoxyribonucleotidase
MIYLDCDGVYADFVTGILEAMDYDWDGYQKWPWGQVFDIFPLIGSSWADASRYCDADFWANLPWMPDGKEIIHEVLKRVRPNETMVLTKPMDHDGSYTGKAQWITRNIPGLRKRLVPTHVDKHEFAKDFNTLLIDDSQDNVDKFIKAGGAAILVPRPWNENERRFYDGEAVTYVAEMLDRWINVSNHPASYADRKGQA